ncbi:MAG: hypothetical protein COB23_03010 [Methylophaga sp.]|nr:MAG: hypothetical protein COB23_03010 [Methylophaga sp.]
MSVDDLTDTIKPKSDQLNADDMLTGAIVVVIKGVRRGSVEQPVIIDIDGHMPYKPCKTMRRVLVTAWGQDGKLWVGRSMKLYCDPTVKFGGVALGGIRISHISHIGKSINMMLTASRGRKKEVVIHPLVETDHSEVIKKYIAIKDDGERNVMWNGLTQFQQIAIKADFDSRNN